MEKYITVSITEGEKYTVSDIKFDGQMLLPEAELRKRVAGTLGTSDPFLTGKAIKALLRKHV